MSHYGITQNRHCNNDNTDNVMRASVWFEFFGGVFYCQNKHIWEGNMTTRSEIQTENIRSVGFQDDMREGATLRRSISQSLECISIKNHTQSSEMCL